MTVFAAVNLRNVESEPTGQMLTVANGSDIEVLRETQVSNVVGREVIATRCLMSECISIDSWIRLAGGP